MTQLEICNNIGLLSNKMDDICYLMQEIREEYFEKYDGKDKKDSNSIAWEHNRYASFYRILDNCIYEVAKLLKEMDKATTEKSKVVAA